MEIFQPYTANCDCISVSFSVWERYRFRYKDTEIQIRMRIADAYGKIKATHIHIYIYMAGKLLTILPFTRLNFRWHFYANPVIHSPIHPLFLRFSSLFAVAVSNFITIFLLSRMPRGNCESPLAPPLLSKKQKASK